MTTKVLSDADIKAMLGPMHAAYLDAVKANEARRSELECRCQELEAQLGDAINEVGRLSHDLTKANRMIDSLAALVTSLQAKLRKKYVPMPNEGSEP